MSACKVLEETMTKNHHAFAVILGMVLLGGISLAQEPVVNVDKDLHPNLAAAQRLVLEADHYIAKAQTANKYDMQGHAAKARQLLVEVNQELKAAAQAVDAAHAAAAKPIDKSITSTPSPELVSQLTKGLSITPTQASGGAGALFGLAKSRMSAAEFTKVAAAVPGMDGLLKAAPQVSGLSGLQSYLPGGMSGLAPVAASFQKLGLTPDMAGKFVPVLIKYVQSKGGLSTSALLAKALQ